MVGEVLAPSQNFLVRHSVAESFVIRQTDRLRTAALACCTCTSRYWEIREQEGGTAGYKMAIAIGVSNLLRLAKQIIWLIKNM